jgi:hypothetical protein
MYKNKIKNAFPGYFICVVGARFFLLYKFKCYVSIIALWLKREMIAASEKNCTFMHAWLFHPTMDDVRRQNTDFSFGIPYVKELATQE